MMKKIMPFLFSTLIGYGTIVHADPRITFFVRQYPELSAHIDNDIKTNKFKRAQEKILADQMPSPPATGLFSTYAGFMTVSARDGSFLFPRKQAKPIFHIVVTPLIEPVMMVGTTVHHWELIKKMPAALYTVELKQDSETELWYWQTQKQTLPKDRIVPLDSILLFAPPSEVVVPTGASRAHDVTNLSLPDIYIKNSFKVVPHALSTLQHKHFFRQILKTYKRGTGDVQNSWAIQINER